MDDYPDLAEPLHVNYDAMMKCQGITNECIGRLERLNSTLAEQIDRMRPVVEAARDAVHRVEGGISVMKLDGVVKAYETQMTQYAKETK